MKCENGFCIDNHEGECGQGGDEDHYCPALEDYRKMFGTDSLTFFEDGTTIQVEKG